MYVPGAKDNEEESNVTIKYILEKARVAQTFIDDVSEGILATKHISIPKNPVFHWALDIDLLSFGEPWEVFLKDGRDIREEFRAIVPLDEDFERGRREVLSKFNLRTPFYFTEYFENNRGKKAKENLKRALARVTA